MRDEFFLSSFRKWEKYTEWFLFENIKIYEIKNKKNIKFALFRVYKFYSNWERSFVQSDFPYFGCVKFLSTISSKRTVSATFTYALDRNIQDTR